MTANAADTLLLVEDDAASAAALGTGAHPPGIPCRRGRNSCRGSHAGAPVGARATPFWTCAFPTARGWICLANCCGLPPRCAPSSSQAGARSPPPCRPSVWGVVDFLAKPVHPDRVASALRSDRSKVAEGDVAVAEQVPSLDRVEWEHIQRVLAECEGNVSKAARLLGLHRRSLQRKLGKRPSAR